MACKRRGIRRCRDYDRLHCLSSLATEDDYEDEYEVLKKGDYEGEHDDEAQGVAEGCRIMGENDLAESDVVEYLEKVRKISSIFGVSRSFDGQAIPPASISAACAHIDKQPFSYSRTHRPMRLRKTHSFPAHSTAPRQPHCQSKPPRHPTPRTRPRRSAASRPST